MSKKKIALIVTICLLAIVISLGLWAFVIEPNRLVLNSVTVALPNWPAPLNGLKIVAIGDIHGGSNFITEAKIQKLVEQANAQNPDVTVLLGDFVTGSKPTDPLMSQETVARNLSGLRAKYGVFAVLGNHDWWTDGFRMLKALSDVGIRVIDNDAVRIIHNGQTVWMMGVPDFSTQWHASLKGAWDKITTPDPVIAITHSPDVFPELSPRITLTLAAHTHGGQVSLPLVGRLVVPSMYKQRYAAGLIRDGDRSLFVTTGVGTSVFPVRFGVPPEVAILTLVGK
ncbi:MAG: metallophosphoesterase [Pyrinomonadaceae bacterium]